MTSGAGDALALESRTGDAMSIRALSTVVAMLASL